MTNPDLVWMLVAVLGVGTFLLRLSFIQLYAWLDEFPPGLERALRFIPRRYSRPWPCRR